MYWSQMPRQLGYFGVEKNNTRISETEMNVRIAVRFTNTNCGCSCRDRWWWWMWRLIKWKFTHQITVSPDNCVILIEDIWIDKYVDLLHELVIKEIGDILDDDSEEHDDYEKLIKWWYKRW
jgi:hypothetical protein